MNRSGRFNCFFFLFNEGKLDPSSCIFQLPFNPISSPWLIKILLPLFELGFGGLSRLITHMANTSNSDREPRSSRLMNVYKKVDSYSQGTSCQSGVTLGVITATKPPSGIALFVSEVLRFKVL